MNPPSDSQSPPPTPEQFCDFLRKRVQEAIAASVHHASLSQQYLSLSQRFSALAEQATLGTSSLDIQSLRQLDQEACTGTPAAPIAASLKNSDIDSANPQTNPSVSTSASALKPDEIPNSTVNEPVFYSPPAKFSVTEITANLAASNTSALAVGAVEPVPSLQAESIPAQPHTPAAPVAPRGKKRRPITVRSVLDRARVAGLETARNVRVKAKKTDLKPQLRSTTEELTLELKRGTKPAMISLIITGLALFVLALRQMQFFEEKPVPPIICSISNAVEPVEESAPIEMPAEEAGEQLEQPIEEMIEEPVPEPEPMPDPEPKPETESMPEVELADTILPETPDGKVPSSPETTNGTDQAAIDNRSEAGRKVMLEKYGGSAASESAVGLALEWLAARQRVNGTWDFIDVGPCTDKGSVNNPIGGTAYALLPFLAAGQTHKDGQYKKQIQAGLAFLTNIGVTAPAGYDLRGVVNKADDDTDPNYAYYVHGAATLALCEAYGMTKDRKLKQAAEGAVMFLVQSQNPRGGGWRYNPREDGSTSVTAIQVMALKAAEKAGIKIPDSTWKGISFYLDSVSVDGQGRYGYEVENKTYAMSVTSMAMLSRMYLGWGRDDGDMRPSIALIDKSTSTENYYTNYFATQVMKNWGGPEWDRWNGRLRDQLTARQETDGPAKGSWAPQDRADYSKSGGRLLTTCLATLTLEVYYRNQSLLPEIDSPMSASEETGVMKPSSPSKE
jgi:hypothetical protein